jgi:hypothetical protein
MDRVNYNGMKLFQMYIKNIGLDIKNIAYSLNEKMIIYICVCVCVCVCV